jgi:hypothetical protein
MAKVKKEIVRVVTPVGRLLYPAIAAPNPADAKYDAGKYTCGLLVESGKFEEEIKQIAAAILKVGKDVFGADKVKTLKDINQPLRKGTEDDPEYMRGHYLLKGKSTYVPSVIDAAKRDMSPDEVAKIKGGDWGRLVLTVYGYSNKSSGVSFGLDVIQFARPGEPLGGGKSKSIQLLEEIEVDMDDIDLTEKSDKVEEFAL